MSDKPTIQQVYDIFHEAMQRAIPAIQMHPLYREEMLESIRHDVYCRLDDIGLAQHIDFKEFGR